MREHESRTPKNPIPMIKQIEIDRPGTRAMLVGPTAFGLDAMECLVQGFRFETRVEASHGVEIIPKPGVADRVGIVERGHPDELRVRKPAQRGESQGKMLDSIPHIAAEPNECWTHRRRTISTSAEERLPANGTLGLRTRTRTS